MRLPWRFSRGTAAAPDPAPGGRPDGGSAGAAPDSPPSPPAGAWASLPPLQRTVGEMPLVAPAAPFLEAVPGTRPLPPILEALGHELSPLAPVGLVVGQVRPSAATGSAGHAAVSGSAQPPVRTLQRRRPATGEVMPSGPSPDPGPAPAGGHDEAAPALPDAPPPRRLPPLPAEPGAGASLTRADSIGSRRAASGAVPGPSAAAAVQRSAGGATPPRSGGMRRASHETARPGLPAPASPPSPAASRPVAPSSTPPLPPASPASAAATPADGHAPSPISWTASSAGERRRAGLGPPMAATPPSARPEPATIGPVVARLAAGHRTGVAAPGSSPPAPARGQEDPGVGRPPFAPRRLPPAGLPVAAVDAEPRVAAPSPVRPIAGAAALALSVQRRPAPEGGEESPPAPGGAPGMASASAGFPAFHETSPSPGGPAAGLPSPAAVLALPAGALPPVSTLPGGAHGATGVGSPAPSGPGPGRSRPWSPPVQMAAARASGRQPQAPEPLGRRPSAMPLQAGRRMDHDGGGLPAPSTASGPLPVQASRRIEPPGAAAPVPAPVPSPAPFVPLATPVVQRIDGHAPAGEAGGQTGSGPRTERELDELARALFGRIRSQLKTELIHEREAKGLPFDHH